MICLWIALLNAAAAAPQASSPDRVSPSLDLQINPLIELHYTLRAAAENAADAPEIEGVEAALDAVQALDRQFPFLGWGLLEGPMSECSRAEDALRVFEKLPETRELRNGTTVHLRSPAMEMARAYAAIEERFLAAHWPQRQKTLRRARSELEAKLLPKQRACFEMLARHLGVPTGEWKIPVILTTTGPFPRAFTHRRRSGPVCFVATGAQVDSQTLEMILHEATHALDLYAGSNDTLLTDLRKRLRASDLPASHRGHRDLPHTVMFVNAAETVRRVLDADHRDYGDVAGYYEKVPEAAGAIRQFWTPYVEGTLPRAQFVERVIEAYLAADPPDRGPAAAGGGG